MTGWTGSATAAAAAALLRSLRLSQWWRRREFQTKSLEAAAAAAAPKALASLAPAARGRLGLRLRLCAAADGRCGGAGVGGAAAVTPLHHSIDSSSGARSVVELSKLSEESGVEFVQGRQSLVRLGRDELKPFLSKKKHAFVLYYKMDDLARFVRGRALVGAGGGGGGGGQDADDPDGSAHWQDVHHREAVVLLNDATFDDTLRRSGHVLVFFYATWCNHCSLVKHVFASAAHHLAEEGMRGCMAAAEYSSNPLLEKRLGCLEFLPAFKLFNRGEFQEDHHKLRTKDDFVHLMKRVLGK